MVNYYYYGYNYYHYYGLLLFPWCLPVMANYYFQVSFNEKAILYMYMTKISQNTATELL